MHKTLLHHAGGVNRSYRRSRLPPVEAAVHPLHARITALEAEVRALRSAAAHGLS